MDDDLEKFDKLTTIIKDRVIKTEAINPSKLKPGKVVSEIKEKCIIKFSHTDHKYIQAIFSIRPYKEFCKEPNPFETNKKYCHYDEAHNDYLYQECWIDFLIANISTKRLNKDIWKKTFDDRIHLDITQFEIE